MSTYDPKHIEEKWQKEWDATGAHRALDNASAKKSYLLVEFPYPSGAGLHTGHVRSYTAMDVVARKRRGEGQNVLYPIGWDAFGLPTENYAIKTGRPPQEITKENTDTFRRQLKALGLSFDWDREVNTTDPTYYKWTQWIFLKLYEKGLAYKAKTTINWCPKDKIGLANEEVVDGKCERCGTEVEKREKEQWMLAITKYAQRLYDDLDTVDYIERAKIQQKNWIGPSEGAILKFPLVGITGQEDGKHSAEIFTTRPDTIFGATFMAVSPELAKKWISVGWQASNEVVSYINQTLAERAKAGRKDIEEKTGIDAGIFAINPATNEKIPVWITNYVLGEVGTGAIMAVPAHDDRDFDFAKKYNLPVKSVVEPLFRRTTGDDAVRPNLPLEERDAVACVIKHWSEDKYLCVKWKSVLWNGFVTGGLDGESVAEAGAREIMEETGFKNARWIRSTNGKVNVQFYHVNKKVNRWAHFEGAYFELADNAQELVSAEEQAIHDIVWIEKDKVEEFVTAPDIKFIWQQLMGTPSVWTEDGILTDSGEFTGMNSEEAKKKITEKLGGTWTTTFKLRDWVFSRQRYWGEPIPMVFCEKDGWVPMPEDQLPLTPPLITSYQYTDTGESPLASVPEWVNTTCPKCGGPGKRETDTMPNWAGSSWYFLRYADPHNDQTFAGKEKLNYWTPVDWYNGGMEHTVLHLLYSRFWHKFLFDLGLVPTPEPYQKRTSHGLILAEGGEKMSKSKGNVVSPDEIVERFGADSLRVYEMFMGPFDQAIAWSTDGLVGARRFLERVWACADRLADTPLDPKLQTLCNKTIKKVTEDIEELKMNTAIASLMTLLNELTKGDMVSKTGFEALVRLLAPFAPHMTEELWQERLTKGTSIHKEPWPSFDPLKLVDDEVTIAVQVNGKLRGTFIIHQNATQAEAEAAAKSIPTVTKWLNKATISKIVFIPNRLLGFVTTGPDSP